MPNHTMPAAVGAFALTGPATGLRVGRKMPAAAGAFVLAGRPAGLLAARKMTASAGALTLASRGSAPLSLPASAGSFALAGQVASLYASADDLVFYDGVAEWTVTSGTGGVYVLKGAMPENDTFNSQLAEGKQCYVSIRDSVRYEHILARFAKPDRLIRIAVDRSSNANAAVDWPTTGRRIVKLEPAAAAFIRALRALAALTSYVYRTPSSGNTITLGADDKVLQLNPAGTLATLTVVLPPSPAHRDTVEISTSQQITALTVSPAGAETVLGGSLQLNANSGASWRYRSANTTWFRRY